MWRRVAGGLGTDVFYLWLEVEGRPDRICSRIGRARFTGAAAKMPWRSLRSLLLLLRLCRRVFNAASFITPLPRMLAFALGLCTAFPRVQAAHSAAPLPPAPFSETHLPAALAGSSRLSPSPSPGSKSSKGVPPAHTVLSLGQMFLHQNLRGLFLLDSAPSLNCFTLGRCNNFHTGFFVFLLPES